MNHLNICKVILNFQVIVKMIKDPDKYFKSNSYALNDSAALCLGVKEKLV